MRNKSHFLTLLLLAACASQHNAFQDIDYTHVYERYQQRENDPGYTPPSVIGCVDDDLYNCSGKNAY